MIDWAAIVGTVPSIAVALLFAFFMERQRHDHLWTVENLMNTWTSELQKIVEQEREARRESTARLAEEIKANTAKLTEITVLITDHDRRASAAMQAVHDIREATRPKPRGRSTT